MTSGEARAPWQRMANHCFFQEDASRAPKQPCRQHGMGGGIAERSGLSAFNCMCFSGSESNSDFPRGTKWWLQFELNPTYLKESLSEQNEPGEDIDGKTKANLTHSPQSTCDLLLGSSYDFGADGSVNSSVLPSQTVSTSFMRNGINSKFEELKSKTSDIQPPLKCKKDLDECLIEDELKNYSGVENLVSKEIMESYFELEPQCQGRKKVEPWWQIADKSELALLVAQRSLYQVENCELPQSHNLHAGMDSFVLVDNLNQNRTPLTNIDQKEYTGTCKQADYMLKTFCTDGQSHTPDNVGLSKSAECQLETKEAPEIDQNKAQLLQALCHSQTRARKAEIAAQKAHNEKEHIVKLFFRQASHLFAYKQWLHLLQLESLCLQMKIREHQISTLLPDLPRMLFKWPDMGSVPHHEVREKGKKKKKKCSTCRYLFAFAIGFSVASAGLVLGLTLGWFPLVL